MNFSCNCEANAKRSLAQERNMIERDAGSCSDSELSDVEDPDDLSFDDWNKRCLHVINLPTDTDSSKLKKYQALTALSKDFVTCAVTYGKTIISEMFLDEKLKSVTPSLVGGIAGGQKYLLRGILFKLADGQHQGPYDSSDEAAAKALNNDLKGAVHVIKCGIPQLRLALQALIDYK
eukprot:1929-Heterococcus_DN1.PRE.1